MSGQQSGPVVCISYLATASLWNVEPGLRHAQADHQERPGFLPSGGHRGCGGLQRCSARAPVGRDQYLLGSSPPARSRCAN